MFIKDCSHRNVFVIAISFLWYLLGFVSLFFVIADILNNGLDLEKFGTVIFILSTWLLAILCLINNFKYKCLFCDK